MHLGVLLADGTCMAGLASSRTFNPEGVLAMLGASSTDITEVLKEEPFLKIRFS